MNDVLLSGGRESCVRPPRRSGARQVRCHGRSPAAVVVFLVLFAILIGFVCQWYLFPTMEVVKSASHAERLKMAAYARLILAILLFILIAALSITFRFGRFFFPRPQPPRTQTKYVDAWAEAGRRAAAAPDDEEAAEEE